MSRIHEALRRQIGKEGAPPEQSAFRSAWDTPGGKPAGSATTAVRRTANLVRAEGPVGPLSFSSAARPRLASGTEADPGLLEQYRRLAATLHHAHLNNGLRSIMVSSAMPGDGKTLTAVNLALVLSESYRYNVLLIDADLRRPSIQNVVDAGYSSGLSDALRAEHEQPLALARLSERLTLLPAGPPIANSLEALTSPRMRHILDEAAERFDWIIMDAPPVGPTADARILAEMVGGTLFVIHAGRTQFPEVRAAVDALGPERILGVVLNGAKEVSTQPYYAAPPGDDRA